MFGHLRSLIPIEERLARTKCNVEELSFGILESGLYIQKDKHHNLYFNVKNTQEKPGTKIYLDCIKLDVKIA
jgi:hypothetical protein